MHWGDITSSLGNIISALGGVSALENIISVFGVFHNNIHIPSNALMIFPNTLMISPNALLRRWDFCRIFYFLPEQLLEFVLTYEKGIIGGISLCTTDEK